MTDDFRPNPDALLASIQKEESRTTRGSLKIFFGMCPGVGKTYAMLKAARQRLTEGVDVVTGLVETHGRQETAALLEDMVVAPRKKIEYRGTVLEEMDVEGILFLHPQLVLVDELAHTNAPGSRHPKRYQDVEEILAAGIDVYSTLNVQHIESRADTVRQITGATVQETVPDSVLEWADEIELIDITPARLRERLAEGKVYLGPRAEAAAENFFKETNLTALRELALRLTAERVDQQLRDFRQGKQIHEVWKSGDRLLVAVGPSPFSQLLVRWTRRMAYAMNAPWIAVHVESSAPLSERDKRQLDLNLRLARELGAEIMITHDQNRVAALVRVAQENNVTQIVVGKPRGSLILDFIRGGGLVDQLIRNSGHIDVYVVPAETPDPKSKRLPIQFSSKSNFSEYLTVFSAVAATTILAIALESFTGYWAIALMYLFSIIMLSLFVNRGPLFAAAALSALTWDFLFIPPKYTFYIEKLPDILMLAMYFIIALATGHLTARLREQQQDEHKRELRASALYRLVNALSSAHNLEEAFAKSVQQIRELFGADAAFLTTESEQPITLDEHTPSSYRLNEKEMSVALWSYRNGKSAGRFTDTLPTAEAYYTPLRAGGKSVGVLGIKVVGDEALMLYQRDILETFATQVALAIEREKWRTTNQESQLAAKSQQLQKTLFNSISHELRTPLSVIQAATTQLASSCVRKDCDTEQHENLVGEIQQATSRLNRLVQNLLNSARLESGQLQPKWEWGEVEDLFSGAAQLLGISLPHESLRLEVAPGLPLVHADFGLLQQAISNLIDNAFVHTPEGTPIRLIAEQDGNELLLCVADEGPGIQAAALSHLFEKFYRASDARPGGTGLGLSIAKSLVEANHGELNAANRPKGGAIFTIRLPIEKAPKIDEH